MKQHPNHDQFEEVKFTFPFIAHPCDIEHLSLLSLEPKLRPSGHQNVVLDSGRDSTLILHNISLKKENHCAMVNLEAPTLELKKNNSTNKHEGFSFETSRISCSLLESLELITLSATRFCEDHNHLLVLVYKLFRRMVVDAYVYHKYCKSCGCIVILSLQLER